ncbi:uncharacterized protein LOC114430732 [Parambassis ranga]|uniref:Uncharacterized protein LOC114430732 n=1 Tax=Parambassis ranga TaxID=210632 RepID=A0A6P7HR81_9TELE|nr:uncharacterized protein LOC114430732 [Parambassis ranga]
MQQKNSKSIFKCLLIFGLLYKHCKAQVSHEDHRPPDGRGGDASAFYALRSCHQLLQGDSGEFFSPDYLCSNPPLWCNWTIQVDPGKRVHLHLEDLTLDDDCQQKQDQIHVDEPVNHLMNHKVLQKCWREAKYMSSSNILYVVLLIGGWPTPPYRGFYGRYQSFGLPVVYNPQEGLTDRGMVSNPSSGLMDFSGPLVISEETDPMYDYYDQNLAMTPEEAADTEVLHPPSENYTQFTATVPAPIQRTYRSGRGVANINSSDSDSAVYSESAQTHDGQHDEVKPSSHTPKATQRNVEDAAVEQEWPTQSWEEEEWEEEEEEEEEEEPADGENSVEVNDIAKQTPSTSEESEPQPTEQGHPHPNVVEQLSDHRGNPNMRNHSDIPHLPGDHLFEVTVEVNFSQDLGESWDDLARSLLLSVKALIIKQLESLRKQMSVSPKRIKRLNAGVLYILWLQIGQGPGGLHVHRILHSAIQGLIATGVGLRGNYRKAVIMSVSTADVNECGTQLVLCDINADCVNQFGSYSCHCRPGFQDESRLGSGGTVCVDMTAAGCSSDLSAETKGVYVLFFLLSSLILMLLVGAGTLYHRHHKGAFLVRCHSTSSISPPDPNNNHNHHHHSEGSYSCPPVCNLPPPPPPARGPREGWKQVKEHCPASDLPLLHFSPLLPPDSYMDPQESGKK